MKQEWKEAAKAYATEWHNNQLEMCPQVAYRCFLAGVEWHERSLNWIRDLVKAGIEKPDEEVNILKRIDVLLND